MDENKSSPERCVLCLDQKRLPVRIQCGHSFCTGCLDVYKSYKKYPWANKCPICRDVLKEKKRTTKRKYSDVNADPEETSRIAAVIETENNSNNSIASPPSVSQQINIFEEFMALAFDVYENADESVQDLTEDDDNYYDEEHETQTDLDFSDSYHDDINYYTDSDDYNDANEIDDDDDDRDYFYLEDDEDETYQPPRSRRHVDGFYPDDYPDENDENGLINVDDTADYEVDSLIPRDWDDNNINSDIDWETVIASDVIIID